jgi:hypothetical protein
MVADDMPETSIILIAVAPAPPLLELAIDPAPPPVTKTSAAMQSSGLVHVPEDVNTCTDFCATCTALSRNAVTSAVVSDPPAAT